MLFRTHIVFSLVVYFLLSYYIEMPFYVLIFILLATLFVDIDIRGSKFGNYWYFRPFQWITHHRGVFHSLFVGLFLSLLIGLISLWGCFGFFIGYISHLFLDCFTRRGVELFWPLKFKIRGFVKSGGFIEKIFFILLLFMIIFLFGKVIFISLF